MEKTKKIKEVMKLLDEGKYVQIDNGVLCEDIGSRGYPLIFWRIAGESANRRTLKDLTWIINTLLEKRGKDFEYKVVKSWWGD